MKSLSAGSGSILGWSRFINFILVIVVPHYLLCGTGFWIRISHHTDPECLHNADPDPRHVRRKNVIQS